MNFLYTIFIYPLETLMKIILEFMYYATDNYGLSIILLSIIINILLLPLYYMAEKWKANDRSIQNKMQSEIDNIKKYYVGQERYYYIQTVYRRYNYHPSSSIKASIGFLIQVPFFFAAYHFLSNYLPIHGVNFGVLNDLGSPDKLFGSMNLLPFAMTIANLLSAYIYIELLNKVEKIQLFSLAFIFLIILYNEPAGLLLYWTMNNVFSLIKNIIEKKFKLGPLFSKPFQIQKGKTSFLKKIPYIESLITLIALYLYLYLVNFVSPDGITKVFAIEIQKIILYIVTILILLTAFNKQIVTYFNEFQVSSFDNKKWSDFLLILLPMTPIIQYILLNQEILSIYSSFYVLIVSLIITIIMIISVPIILSPLVPRYIMISLGLSLIFLIFYMPTLALDNTWHKVGNIKKQLLIFIAIFSISTFLYKYNNKFLKILTLSFFIVNTLIILLMPTSKDKVEQQPSSDNPTIVNSILNKIEGIPMPTKPDIYLLTYDAYVGNETMLQYGIDNIKQEEYLKSNDFKIYNNIYSIGSHTWSTMLRILHMSDKRSLNIASDIGGNSSIHKILRNSGYNLAGVYKHGGWWRNKKPSLDFYYPSTPNNGHSIIFKSILEGEFHFDADLKFNELNNTSIFIEKKREFMSLDIHPKFMYTHTGPGHSQNSGKCLKNENMLFKKRLDIANKEMRADIKAIEKNNPDALIIICGDHGPYLTENCHNLNKFKSKKQISRLDIQDRFGTFLAIKWPKNIKMIDYDITVIQEIFPIILASILDDKTLLKKNRISTKTIGNSAISGVYVENGIIHGGLNDQEPLFLNTTKK